MSFDFLNRGEGFFIALDNNGGESHVVYLRGRIRGEGSKSVYQLYGPFDLHLNSWFKIFLEAFWLISLFIHLRARGYLNFDEFYFYFVSMVITSIDLLISLVKARVTFIPSSLKYKQINYNQEDYYE